MAVIDVTVQAVTAETPRERGWWRSLPPKSKVGAYTLVFFVLVGIIGPFAAPYNPSAETGTPLMGPTAAHLLGTTQSGQDVLSQFLIGTRATLELGLIVGIVASLLFTLIGVASGYLAGLWDDVMSLLTNVVLVLPALPLLVVLLGYEKSAGQSAMIIVLSLLSWPWGARVLRAQTLTLRTRDYVLAARELAMPSWRIVVFQIVPNQIGLIAANFVGVVVYAVGTSVALTFLGLGSTSTWSLGTMLYWAESQSALQLGAWWWFAPPGLAVALIGTALVLLNFGLDEYVNPRLREVTAGRRQHRVLRPVDPTPVVRDTPAGGQRGTGAARLRRSAKGALSTATAVAGGQEVIGAGEADLSALRVVTEHDHAELHAARRPVLEIKGLSVVYQSLSGNVPAVTDFSLTLGAGEVVGLCGESGSGKSTLAYGATRLLRDPAMVTAGSVIYHGQRIATEGVDLLDLDTASLRNLRWREISIVFQSAMNSLNPVMRVQEQLTDVMFEHLDIDKEGARKRAEELLSLVGIPRDRLRSYPHELSGGMRQRVMIAIALAAEPELIIMDEPTTALDVVVQREILEKVIELKDRLGFAVLFITHDLSLLLELADRIAVMYGGRLIELASRQQIAKNPMHPYTRGLLNSFPSLRGSRRELAGIPGSPPHLQELDTGCSFRSRCAFATDACADVDMHLEWTLQPGSVPRGTACPFAATIYSPAPAAPAPEPATND